MKRYRLLKDLPTFKAGEEFYIDDNGNLISAGHGTVVAYAESTLKKFPNILKDWFEETKEYKRWRGGIGEIYWCYDADDGEVCCCTENRDEIDDCRYRLGNYFKTEKEAEKYGEYLEALQIIKDDAKGFEPDWQNWSQAKYYGYYDHDDDCLDWDNVFNCQKQGAVYFRTKEDIRESFEKHRKEWLTMLGVEE